MAIEVVFSSGENPRYAKALASRRPLGRRKTQGNAHQESGSTDDLNKYRLFGVREVWFWIKNELKIYILFDDIYQKSSYSFLLPKLEDKLLIKCI